MEEYVDLIVEKSIYTCINQNFIHRLSQMNDGDIPREIYIAGLDTEVCVLRIATALFEYNIRPVVLASYCASNGGLNSHEAGIRALERLIGKEQIIEGSTFT